MSKRTLLLAALACATLASAQPRLQTNLSTVQLVVNDRPFLVRGAEVFNSSTSNLAYMEPLWSQLAASHVNTVLAPISWEQFEPKEGTFDFTLIDGLIDGARRHRQKLIVLWFGSWKNLVSSYAPRWVRENPARFPMVKNSDGHTVPTLSPFGSETLAADTRAFVRLMQRIREVDAKEQTVIMVQVQNEMGLSTEARDHSAPAEAAFHGPVPAELLTAFAQAGDSLPSVILNVWKEAGHKSAGTWREVFGASVLTHELFMSWHFAKYAGQVAAEGRKVYDLPMFVNGALGRSDGEPGSYPSGGPMPAFLELWRTAAPAIDLLSPDIYATNFADWAERFSRPGNPLFVPEMFPVPANAVIGIGQFRGLGVAPFGFEGRVKPGDEFSKVYGLLAQIEPQILSAQARGAIAGAGVNAASKEAKLRLGDYTVEVRLRVPRRVHPPAEDGYALVIAETPDSFLVLGRDVDIWFSLPDQPPQIVALDRVEEGAYRDGQWVPGRRLNGDEIMLSYDFKNLAAERRTGTGLRFGWGMPTLQRATVFRTR